MKRILPVIVVSQFFCTSLWFAGNAVMPDLAKAFHVPPGYLAHVTSAVQFGFILGTLVFAVLTIADRFSPSMVFFIAAILAALTNLGICIGGIQTGALLLFRFLTGFFLAGIYPVGMKIASDHYQKGLGRSLGFLVGALVLGTAFPHLLKTFTQSLPWKYVVLTTSVLAVTGGLLVYGLVPNGPYRKASQKIRPTAFAAGFKNASFRSAALGYFGHMWELYAFWAFVPVMLAAWQKQHAQTVINVPLLSFLIIGTGSIACVAGGFLSQRFGVKRIAATALFLSGSCCMLSPLFLLNDSAIVFIAFLFFWGWVVIADSPLFSTLVAQTAPEGSRGTSLTIVNCIGFSITIISIQLINLLLSNNNNTHYVFMILAAGPILGLIALSTNRSSKR